MVVENIEQKLKHKWSPEPTLKNGFIKKVATTQLEMKKVMTIFGKILLVSLVLTSCGNGSNEKKEGPYTVDTLKVNTITPKPNDAIKTEPEKTVPTNVSCKLYFLGNDFTDEETGETSKGAVSEREGFKTKKAYTFCYDSEGFHHLTIIGTGKQLSFIIKRGNKEVFKKVDFDLVDKLTFTSKDFNFEMGETYSIIIQQNTTILFSGKIDSQGCM